MSKMATNITVLLGLNETSIKIEELNPKVIDDHEVFFNHKIDMGCVKSACIEPKKLTNNLIIRYKSSLERRSKEATEGFKIFCDVMKTAIFYSGDGNIPIIGTKGGTSYIFEIPIKGYQVLVETKKGYKEF